MTDLELRKVFADNLRRQLNEHRMNQLELAKRLGTGSATVTDWVKLRSMPRSNTLKRLVEIFGCQMSDLLSGPDGVYDDSRQDDDLPPNIIPLPKMKKVPLIGSIACGGPILAEENIEGFLTMPGDVGADFCLRCKGDSMINARIFDGDIVYIRQQPQVEDGEIAAVMVGDDEATLKRVRLFSDHIIPEPENPQYRAKSFWDADMAQVRVLGKAVAFVGTIS